MTWGQWACGLAAKDRTGYLMDENTSYFISVFPGWVHTNCPLRCSTITQSNTMLTPPNYIVPDHGLTWTRLIEGHGRTSAVQGTIDSASRKWRSCGSAHLLFGFTKVELQRSVKSISRLLEAIRIVLLQWDCGCLQHSQVDDLFCMRSRWMI